MRLKNGQQRWLATAFVAGPRIPFVMVIVIVAVVVIVVAQLVLDNA